MAFSSAGGGASRAQINVTPLIDVLLTLIVMFMLVVSMDKEHGEATQIPQPPKNDSAQNQPERTVIIQVLETAKDGINKDQRPIVKVNREEVRWQDLDTILSQIYLTRVEKVAFVRGDADVSFEYIAEVIDVAHHAGVERIGLLTQDRMVEGE
jgi:biopolymer transport protein TolR